MKKDIEFPEVTDVAVAIVREEDGNGIYWNVYLLNLKATPITNVIISSKGYGKVKGKDVKTSMLRHFYELIPAKTGVKVEHFPEDLLTISNEFLVSFYIGAKLHDKKYIFVRGSIEEENLTNVPVINLRGVMIK